MAFNVHQVGRPKATEGTKSTGVSIHNNLDSLVLARRLLRPTCAAAGAFHPSIFAWTASGISRLFTAT